MSYATQAQLIERYGEVVMIGLTDRAEMPSGSIDASVVDRALADTDAVIDGRLKGRYALPLVEVPPLLVDLALCIAIWKLHRHEPNPKIKDDYLGAMKTLAEIGTGAVRLPIDGEEPIGSGRTGARVTDRERPFTEQTMKGFI